MKRFFTFAAVSALATAALAMGTFAKVFDATYKVSPDSNLGKANCVTCHTSKRGGKLNAYGKDLEAAMKEAGVKKISADILKKVEGLDSNKNGTKNIDEIKADKLPG